MKNRRRVSLPPTLRIATQALGRNRFRTVIALLGLAIGVGAVMTTVALGSGAQLSIQEQIRAAGLNVIVVRAGNYEVEGEGAGVAEGHAAARTGGSRFARIGREWPVLATSLVLFHPEDDPTEKHDHPTAAERLGDSRAGLGSAATLTVGDAEAIRRLPGVLGVASGIHENVEVASGERTWFTRLHGTDVNLPSVRQALVFPYGRFIDREEMEDSSRAVVLGRVAAERLFGAGIDPVGREVVFWNQSFRVVGVAASSNWMTPGAPGDDQIDAVYVPVTTIQKLLNLTNLNTITVTAASSGEVTRIAGEIEALLRRLHGIADSEPDDFTVSTQASQSLAKGLHPSIRRVVAGNLPSLEQATLKQLAATLERSSRTMTALLACIAAVSLLVGGIGIGSVMLLSVTERTREIGVRLSVGADARHVRAQFFAEALTLSLVGGVVGIVAGSLASLAVTHFLDWPVRLSAGAALLAFGVAAAIGMISGFYPAHKAARLDPVEALRYE